MFELGYDSNLVKLNCSINTISHTTMNTSNCFSNVTMMYRIYNDIELFAQPLDCNIPIDYANVYLAYQNGSKNVLIPIFKC